MSTLEMVLLSRASALFPNRPSVASIWRWATRGVRGVRLHTVRVGGRSYVTADDVREFLDALNRPTDAAPTTGANSRRAKEAAATLEAAGF